MKTDFEVFTRDRRGEHMRVFTDEQIRELRQRYEEGESQYDLARIYGVSQPSVCRIVNGHTYSHVGD